MRWTTTTVDGVLGVERCQGLIAELEARGFGAAPIMTAMGPRMAPRIRNNTRVMVDDWDLARELWRAVAAHAPVVPRWKAVGLNERFRAYRYEVGQQFNWHHDGAFHRSDSERSFVTCMFFLNGGFGGGHTEFDHPRAPEAVVPQAGRMLLFDHGLRHRGAPVRSGTKYVLRTDVMYRVDFCATNAEISR